MTRSISFSRPTTGSSLPSAASLVRLRPNSSSSLESSSPRRAAGAGRGRALASARALAAAAGPESMRMTSLRIFSESASKSGRMRAATPSFSRTRPSRMCSVPM